VLLVDHHDAEAAEGHRLLDQCVGADHEVDLAGRQRGEHPLALLARDPVGEQLDGEGPVAEQRGALVGHGELGHEGPDGREVLLGQHLGRRHERALVAALHRGQERGHRHHRLAGADVALQQAVHRDGSGEVGVDLGEDALLVAREREGQRVEEAADELAARHVRDALAGGLQAALAHHEGELDAQQLVEHEAPARLLGLVHRLGGVDAPERPRAVDEVVLVEQPVGQRLDEVAGPPQALGHPAAEVLRVQPELVGLRVDGGDLQAVLLVEEVDLGVGQLLLPAVVGDLAEEHGLGALGQLPRPPRLVEERDAQIPRAVGDAQLGAGLPATPPGHGRRRHHAPEHPHLVVDPKVADRGLLRLVEVAPRVVREQVEDRRDLDLGEHLGPLGADAVEPRDRQLGQLAQPSGHGYSMPKRYG
jgi:hypothetical protein